MQRIRGANLFFSTAVTAFKNPVARKIANTTQNVFANKVSIEYGTFGRLQPDRMWEDTISKTFQDPSAKLQQLKFILGVDNPQK